MIDNLWRSFVVTALAVFAGAGVYAVAPLWAGLLVMVVVSFVGERLIVGERRKRRPAQRPRRS